MLKNIVSPLCLICDQTTVKNTLKSVTVRKSMKKSSKCHQAELSSSIPLDFRAKKVKMFMSTKNRKYAKNEEKNIDLFIFTFSRLIIVKSYENRWPLERALKDLSNAAKQIFLVQTIWILFQNEYTWVRKWWKKNCWKVWRTGSTKLYMNPSSISS